MIRIYGASDDLLEIDGDISEEISVSDRASVSIIAKGKAGGVRVIGQYAAHPKAAVWRLSVEPIDEDVPVPWPIRVELAERGYSCVVIIDNGDDKVTAIYGTEDEAA